MCTAVKIKWLSGYQNETNRIYAKTGEVRFSFSLTGLFTLQHFFCWFIVDCFV